MVKPKDQRVRFSFTARALSGLPAPSEGRVYYYDAKVAGLALCVTATGTKTFYFYKWVDKRPQRVRLGNFPDLSIDQARKTVAKMLGEIADGKDPAAQRRTRRTAPTLEDLFRHWIETHAKLHKKTWEADQRLYERLLKPWAGSRLSSIKKTDVQALHAKAGRENGR